jgi:hypothetical protein
MLSRGGRKKRDMTINKIVGNFNNLLPIEEKLECNKTPSHKLLVDILNKMKPLNDKYKLNQFTEKEDNSKSAEDQ